MADSSEPGPSTLRVDGDQDAQLQEAEDQFQQGIQAIRVGKLTLLTRAADSLL